MLLFSCLQFLLIFVSSSSKSPLCRDNESSALLQFKGSFLLKKNASGDPFAYPKTASWKPEESSNCCSWDGVECDNATGHVIGLDLSSSFLYGSINSSSSLFRLVRLQKLNLADNHFNYSQIPSGIQQLSRLNFLNLSHSAFYGQIPPEISELSKMASLDLSVNVDIYNRSLLKLVEPSLNSLLQNLTNLKELHLTKVNISSAVPEILANLSSLTSLILRDCELYGEFPAAVFQLPNLESLSVRFNPYLTGHFPEFNKSSPLVLLKVGGTRFYGELPDSIGNLCFLKALNARSCNFSGPVPSSLANLTELEFLDLSYNNFSSGNLHWLSKQTKLTVLSLARINLNGYIPSSFQNLTHLSFLDLYMNNLTGQIPSWLGNLTQLTTLALSYNKFHGSIPQTFSNLVNLEFLYLSNNNFSSGNLHWLGKQTKLTVLSLARINLNGYIPSSFQNLTRLSYLNLQMNYLTGQIPSWLGNLTQLTTLALLDNKFHGTIPESFSNLVNLERLYIQTNDLSGTVELDMFLSLQSLTIIHLSFNRLSLLIRSSANATSPRFEHIGFASCNLTEFPSFLQYQHKLQWLDLSSNKIQGQVPKWLFNIGKDTLTLLSLENNSLTGSFGQPSAVLPWTRLKILNLGFNMLQGSLPIPQPSLFFFSVFNNSMTGEISPLICKLSSLVTLHLAFNNLSGDIPQCLGYFSSSLLILNLGNNRLHGAILQSYIVGSNLRMIELSHNQLQGPVPRSLTNCTKLEILDLGNNQVNDVFPSWIGTLQKLKILFLRSNQFHGELGSPETKVGFPYMHIIDLSYNSFTGKLPFEYIQNWHAMENVNEEEFGYLAVDLNLSTSGGTVYSSYPYTMIVTNKGAEMVYGRIPEIFTGIDLSNNRFEGSIPESIGNLQGLQLLNLSSNILTGRIPSSLGNLTELESLDLSQNKLFGEIPNQLTDLTFLAVLNLSHNHLTGLIPRGKQFDTFQNSSFLGNPGLCGDPMSKKCGNNETPPPPLPHSNPDDGEDSKFPSGYDWIFMLAGYGSGLVVGLVIGHTITKRKHHWFIETFGRRRQMKKQSQRMRKQRN